MAYRNGTYLAFAADGCSDPTQTDLKYYSLMSAWAANENIDFTYTNSHDKVAACRDSSKDETIKRSLRARLDNSKNMVLFVGDTTRLDDDFVPYEIGYAVKKGIPVIVCYVDWKKPIVNVIPRNLKALWPKKLKEVMESSMARTIHVPCKRDAIKYAVKKYNAGNLPSHPITIISEANYRSIGLL